MKDSPDEPKHVDPLGRLCQDGFELGRYLFQVPDDEGERERVREILEAILADPAIKGRTEFPKIAQEIQRALEGPPSPEVSELVQDGFERMLRLWDSVRSGIF